MKTRSIVLVIIAGMLGVVGLVDADEQVDLAGVKCPVSGQPVKAASAVEFNGGKVYFCCNNCPKAFNNDTAKYTDKANHQLARTGQATQKKCPKTGRNLNPNTAIDVDGVSVCFCCNGCKGWAQQSEGDELITKLFSSDAFAKGFTVGEE